MNDFFTKAIAWIKANLLLSIGLLLVIVFLLFGRQVKRLLFGTRRVKHRKPKAIVRRIRSRRARTMRKPLPRSVGMHKVSGRGYPKAGGGYVPFKKNKDGSIKKAWQVAGTVAAKSRMSKLRRAR